MKLYTMSSTIQRLFQFWFLTVATFTATVNDVVVVSAQDADADALLVDGRLGNSTTNDGTVLNDVLVNLGPPFAGGIMDGNVEAIVAGTALPKPTHIKLKAAVIPTPPFGIVNEITGEISGFHYDLIEVMKTYAKEDDVVFDITLEKSPAVKYGPALNLIAKDCNTTINPNS